jgi:hypothetical protein
MTYKTQKPSGKLGLRQNQKQTDDIVARHLRLTKSLAHFVSIGDLSHQWAQEIAKREGLVNV